MKAFLRKELKTGLNRLHNFINEKRHYFKSSVEKDMLLLAKDLGRVMALNRRRHIILPPSPQRLNKERKEQRKKREGGSSQLLKTEEKEHALVRTFSRTYVVFPNWKHSVKRYICLPQRQTRHARATFAGQTVSPGSPRDRLGILHLRVKELTTVL